MYSYFGIRMPPPPLMEEIGKAKASCSGKNPSFISVPGSVYVSAAGGGGVCKCFGVETQLDLCIRQSNTVVGLYTQATPKRIVSRDEFF
jgi:hypothetical protein